ncbi:hypothetical protein [Nocardia sp. SSK8]|uniref:hypothetical protein n=1 Tax=Nocardia sp. SSK8 TaxID=3120154 RepID=UPI00300991D9
MSEPVTDLGRGLAAEAIRTGGRGFLWLVAVPLTVCLPLLITFGIAAVAERFAAIPGQLQVPLVYGEVSLTDPAGLRYLWTVPIYAFTACGLGIAVGSVIRTPPAAIAALLFWVYVARFGRNGSLFYFVAVTGAVFTVATTAAQWRRGVSPRRGAAR